MEKDPKINTLGDTQPKEEMGDLFGGDSPQKKKKKQTLEIKPRKQRNKEFRAENAEHMRLANQNIFHDKHIKFT